jgi:hypothetical protein
LNYDKCSALSGPAKVACQLDKALVNVGTLFAQQIEGRVSTEVLTIILLTISLYLNLTVVRSC